MTSFANRYVASNNAGIRVRDAHSYAILAVRNLENGGLYKQLAVGLAISLLQKTKISGSS